MPWPRDVTDPVQRKALAKAAVAALPTTEFTPFSRKDVLAGQAIPFCLGWPQASPPPPVLGPLPTVPTLILEGQADLRTTVADAQSVAAQIPGARRSSSSPMTGTRSWAPTCRAAPQKALNAFFAGTPPQQCATDTPNKLLAHTRSHRRARQGQRRCRDLKTASRDGRARSSTSHHLLITDSISRSATLARSGSRVGGLRGGFARLQRQHDQARQRDLRPRASPSAGRSRPSRCPGRSPSAAARPPTARCTSRPAARSTARSAASRSHVAAQGARVPARAAAPTLVHWPSLAGPLPFALVAMANALARRDLAISAPAQRQPGRLAAVGRGGARPRARRGPSRCWSRSATRPATGATSWSASPSRTRRSRR